MSNAICENGCPTKCDQLSIDKDHLIEQLSDRSQVVVGHN